MLAHMSAAPDLLDPDRLSAADVCREVVNDWRASRYPDTVFEEETHRVSMRVNSWISRASVIAGVTDVFGSSRAPGHALSLESLQDLGEALARRLESENRLLGQVRRGPAQA